MESEKKDFKSPLPLSPLFFSTNSNTPFEKTNTTEVHNPDLRFDKTEEKTHTSIEQINVEELVQQIYSTMEEMDLNLQRKEHEKFLMKGLKGLSQGYQSLEASRPWIPYWLSHSLDLLNVSLTEDQISKIVMFLSNCQSLEGGFGGGPGQFPHLAPTYAATNAIMICGTKEAYESVDRKKMLQFLMRVKQPNGSFVLHEGGETDLRGCYCAMSAAYLLNIITPELTKGVAEYVGSCQTYEGGFGAEPGNEAHGGYTFCGLACLVILGRPDVINLPRLIDWAVHRQMDYEGGFQGRTNKLVDACYSFWQGGIFPLIDLLISQKENKNISESNLKGDWLFRQEDLQKYILGCCQDSGGGIRDKPGKYKDFYHTCYGLSGLSIAQHNRPGNTPLVIGSTQNLLEPTHPVFNIHPKKVKMAIDYFSKLPNV